MLILLGTIYSRKEGNSMMEIPSYPVVSLNNVTSFLHIRESILEEILKKKWLAPNF